MTDLADPASPVPEPPVAMAGTRLESGWQNLPARGAVLAALGGVISFAIPCAVAAGFISKAGGSVSPWLAAPVAGLLGAAFGAWLGVRRHRRTMWLLDEAGFALRRGQWWRSESRVPISRVQHLDLKHGPLQHAFKLATLVIHTAGTRMAAVSVAGLDHADAEHLRDRLARQLDHDDAL